MGDFGKILLGEGKLFADYGETGEAELGYVKGGTFDEGIIYRPIEVDGKKGDTKGDLIVESCIPTLETVMMEVDSTNWKKAFGCINVDATTPAETTITRNLVVADADYLINVAFVGQTKAGKDIVVKLLNAYGKGGINLAFADKAEVEPPAMFVGNYNDEDDTTAPYEVIMDEAVA